MTGPVPELVVVDSGMGNIRSVARALERAGGKPLVSADPEVVAAADRVVVPGVGSGGDVMGALRRTGIDTALRDHVRRGHPYLGICLGLQILLDDIEEGQARGLGMIEGKVARFPDSLGLAVPHMGWNLVRPSRAHPCLDEGYFYFVHAYRATEVPSERELAITEYGEAFPSAVGFSSCLAVQFHPEKSQAAGLRLLERFLRWKP